MTVRTIIIENIILLWYIIVSAAGPGRDYCAPIRRQWRVGDLRSVSIVLLTTRLIETTEFGVLLLLFGCGLQNVSAFFSIPRRNIAYVHAKPLRSAIFHTTI